MISVFFGFTLIGPFFPFLLIILLLVYIAWKVKNRKKEAYENDSLSLKNEKKYFKTYLSPNRSKKTFKNSKSNLEKVNASECSDDDYSIKEMKIYYGSLGGKAKVL